jgi:hypothetical protein
LRCRFSCWRSRQPAHRKARLDSAAPVLAPERRALRLPDKDEGAAARRLARRLAADAVPAHRLQRRSI